MKKALSFCLYGDFPRYVFGMYANLELAPSFFPGWEVHVHVEKGHYAIPRMKALGAVIIEHDKENDAGGMLWRLESCTPEFSHVAFRDADSRLSRKEAIAVQEWIREDTCLHTMHDHPDHRLHPIVGGCWGLKGVCGPAMLERLSQWPRSRRYGDDEKFLAQNVFPLYSSSHTKHTSFAVTGEPFHICERIPPAWRGNLKEVLVLNPDHYPNRLSRFKEWMQSSSILSSLPLRRVRGRTAKDLVVPSWFPEKNHPHYYFASQDHLQILASSILNNDDLVLVLEDDAKPTPDFDLFFERMWNALPQEWLGAMLGGQPFTDNKRVYVRKGLEEHLAGVRGCLGMHATFWNRRGLLRAFDHFTYWNKDTIDQAFTGLQKECPHFYAPAKWIFEIEGVQFGKDS